MKPRMGILIVLGLWSCLASSQTDWENRDRWQKVPEIIDAMSVTSGSWVADIGSGDGYLTRHLMEAVGRGGRVYAVDIDSEALGKLESKYSDQKSLITIHSETDNPMLPEQQLDAVVMLHAYHEMTSHEAMLRHTWEALKPGGRLVIVDAFSRSRANASRDQQTERHELASSLARKEAEEAGFEVLAVRDGFVKHPYHDEMWMLVARRKF